MKLPGTIKKLGTLLEALHEYVDTNQFAITFYTIAYTNTTVIEVRPLANTLLHSTPVFQMNWQPKLKYNVEIPAAICKQPRGGTVYVRPFLPSR